MTAFEMFKELGFRKNTSICYGKEHIVYEKAIGNEDDDSGFDIFTVEFKDKKFTYRNTWNSAIKTDVVMLKAINQQCKELGWLDD